MTIKPESPRDQGTAPPYHGAGAWAVPGAMPSTNMIEAGLEGVEFIVCNTDAQALAQSKCMRRIQMGTMTTRRPGAPGRPAGCRPGPVRKESMDEIMEQLAGSHMVFIARRHGWRHRHRCSPGDRNAPWREGQHPDSGRG